MSDSVRLRKHILPLLLMALILLGCQAAPEPGDGTPTPTPEGNPVPLTVAREILPVTMADLATDPTAYRNKFVRLTGQFKPLPTLVCARDPHPLPASWSLVADGSLAYAQGFSQLRSLLPTGLTMTVVGQWQRWEGPVGCGKDASYQAVWYLKVTQVESPASLARVTLTPSDNIAALLAQTGEPESEGALPGTPASAGEGEATAVSTPGTPTAVGTPAGQETPSAPTPTIDVPPPGPVPIATVVTATATASSDFATPTPTFTVTVVQDTPVTATATVTPGTPNPDGTPTATATGSAQQTGTPTPSPTITLPPGTTATPTAVPTQVSMGKLSDQFLAIELLDAGSVHLWELTIAANDVLTAQVLSPNQNIILTLRDETDGIIATQDEAAAGLVETMVQEIGVAGTYFLEIGSENNAASEYGLMILYKDSYQFLFRGALVYGTPGDGATAKNHDHFWLFRGSANEQITVTVAPDSQSDAFIRFYGPDAELIDDYDFVDDAGLGESETFTYLIPESGLYSLHIGEFSFLPMGYSVTVVRN